MKSTAVLTFTGGVTRSQAQPTVAALGQGSPTSKWQPGQSNGASRLRLAPQRLAPPASSFLAAATTVGSSFCSDLGRLAAAALNFATTLCSSKSMGRLDAGAEGRRLWSVGWLPPVDATGLASEIGLHRGLCRFQSDF